MRGQAAADFFDTQVRGLALRVSAGGKKTWSLIYTRPSTGKRARLTLGTYPELGVAAARVRAVTKKGEIGAGGDPGAERQAKRTAMRVSDLAEIYVERHAKGKRSGREIERRLRKNIIAEIGDVKLAELHRRDVTRALDKILDRGKPIEANRVFEDARSMIRWAVDKGYLDFSPVEAMRRPASTVSRERVLSAAEIRTLWLALPKAAMSPATTNIIRLCLITSQRVGEVAGMRRDEIDLQKRLWSLPGARTKNGQAHSVPLSDAALAVISEVLAASSASAFLFPGQAGAAAPIIGQAVAKAVARSQRVVGIPHWTTHDLRRTALTEMAGLGLDPHTLGHVANHISTTKATVTTAVYARYSYEKEKRAALDAWAARLASLIGQGADVVPIRA